MCSPRPLPFAMAVESEIWVCPHCSTQVDVSALGIYADAVCPQCGHKERVHTHIDHFEVEGILGIGGMSIVFRARDTVLGRSAAIKVLNDAYRDRPERIARFEKECSLMAKVRHENVVSVYTAGWCRGCFYIAMELVEGKNLENLVSPKHPMEQRRALEIVRQAAEGLRAAYAAGMLHRDMKPGNIIITPQGDAKVLDFGLSQENNNFEEEGVVWATPFYAAPETLERAPEDVRTDIYALGMTLRHLLTGVNKFSTPFHLLAPILECKRKLPPLSSVCPDVEESLCDLSDHMTAYLPDNRPSGYEDLLQEIAEVQKRLQSSSVRRAAGNAERRETRDRAWKVGTLVAGALVAVLVACWSSASVRRAEQAGKVQVPSAGELTPSGLPALISAWETMRKGQADETLAAWDSLADSSGVDATVRAYAALQAAALRVVCHRNDEVANAVGRFERLMAAVKEPPLMLRNACMDLKRVSTSLGASSSQPFPVVQNPSILAAGSCLYHYGLSPENWGAEPDVRRALSDAASGFSAYLSAEESAQPRTSAGFPEGVSVKNAPEKASQALSAGDAERALSILTALAHSAEADPVDAAYAALRGAALCVLLHPEQISAPEALLKRLGALLPMLDRSQSEHRHWAESLKLAYNAISKAERSDDRPSPEAPELRAASWLLFTHAMASRGTTNPQFNREIKALLSSSQSGFSACSAQIACIDSAVEKLAMRTKLDLAYKAMQQGEYDRAADMLKKYMKLPAKYRVDEEECRVYQEICRVASTMRDLLKSRCSLSFREGMSPDAWRNLASTSGVNDPTFAAEVYTIALLVWGRHDEAFRANPYASDPSSTSDFATLITNWKTRLKK